jgi:hypothetical protein
MPCPMVDIDMNFFFFKESNGVENVENTQENSELCM